MLHIDKNWLHLSFLKEAVFGMLFLDFKVEWKEVRLQLFGEIFDPRCTKFLHIPLLLILSGEEDFEMGFCELCNSIHTHSYAHVYTHMH